VERFIASLAYVKTAAGQRRVTAQRAELHLDLTDDAIRDLATRPDPNRSA